MDGNEKPKAMGEVIRISEARVRDHLGEMVRGTVAEALNFHRTALIHRLPAGPHLQYQVVRIACNIRGF